MNTPRLSIITVTYNAASTLERTLQSVEKQGFRLFVEHLIIDGASKDATLAIAEAYKERNADMDITIVSERDKGLYDAMNKGLHMAKGEFICFLNAGDKLHADDTIEQIFGVRPADDKAGVIYGQTDIVNANGEFLHKRRLTPPTLLTWKSFEWGMLVCHQSFYARRSFCVDYDTQYRFSADVDWCIKILKRCEDEGFTTEYHSEVFTDYLDEGMTTRNHRASLIERFKVMSSHYGFLSTVWHHFLFIFRK
ncbi:MAG: glycosyltransferase [Bacteroidaceae bacterium]|nr:glycosyltransferase [Bacteroidaceae bacterium]